jgi:hypothetical protein
MRAWRSWVVGCAGFCVVVLLAVSAVREMSPALDRLQNDRNRFGSMSQAERERAYIDLIPLRTDVFDFYRSHLRPGDRYWVQVDPGAFSEFSDYATVVRSVGRMALIPAVEAERPEDADVILSWDKDPGLLPYKYSEQYRAGLQSLFVSRVKR